MCQTFWSCFLFISFTFISCQSNGPIVEISDGKLQGTTNQTVGENKTYYAFRGIPYAKPPIDLLRFANPVKNDKWNGTLDATAEGSVCFQATSTTINDSTIIGSEDCLYINVYTPNVSNESNIPVVVWIHGGSFLTGSSRYSDAGPDYLLEKDVVFVSLNYRLGVFGFLSTEDMASPGNWGLKDQVLALQWVQENIAQFGGDPSKVTIFGESAGSGAVSYLLQAKNKTEGLFRGAIMDSGNSLCRWALTREARKITNAIALKLGIIELSTTTLVEKLRKVDALKLKEAQAIVTEAYLALNGFGGLPMGPVQEPEHADAIFSSRSYQQLLDGDFTHVPVIVGFNSLEFVGVTDSSGLVLVLISSLYNLKPTEIAPIDLTNNVVKKLLASTKVKLKYFGLKPIGLDDDDLAKFLSVDEFVRATRKDVQLKSKYVPVYFYQFSYLASMSTAKGVAHAEELNYVFRSDLITSAEDALTRNRTVTLWTNFVKELNPTPTASDLLQNVTWIPNTSTTDTDNHVQYLNINTSLELTENPYQDDWKFYENIFEKYGDPSEYATY